MSHAGDTLSDLLALAGERSGTRFYLWRFI
jgi:hypothetical protein